jgi:hypothetical protein
MKQRMQRFGDHEITLIKRYQPAANLRAQMPAPAGWKAGARDLAGRI